MVTAMQAVHCVSWEPLSGQDMRLVWQRRSTRNHKEMSTSLFRKSLCVRMRISSLINNPTLAISAGRRHIFAFFNRADEEHRVLRSFFTTAGGTGHRQFNFPSPQAKEGKNHLILFFRFCGKLRGNVAGVEMSPLVYVRRNTMARSNLEL